MAVAGTIAFIVLLIAFRLLLPPVSGFTPYFRRFGKRNSIVLGSIGVVLGAVLIILGSRR
jgi:hypothetical protein